LKEVQRIVGDSGNKFGEDAEHTLAPGLPEKFRRIKLDREYALEKGFFVIEPSGEDVTVTVPAASPGVWQASENRKRRQAAVRAPSSTPPA
jgi:hypothetical protein